MKAYPLTTLEATYLRWAEQSMAMLNCCPLASWIETFEFFDKELTGSKELSPRWKRCVRYTTAISARRWDRRYVDATFGANGKARTLKMVNELDKALAADIQQLSWMGDETKNRRKPKRAKQPDWVSG